ncbi:hypothetical protein [Streptomyces microflavus]|uniref:hypothetical protein n=1 Tax=Streptomyces microflavus TaxID=1919 RepID=UPI003658ADA8
MRELEQVRVFCGIDWASDHHDIAIVDASGALKARARIDDSVEGLNELLRMLGEHGDTAESRGLRPRREDRDALRRLGPSAASGLTRRDPRGNCQRSRIGSSDVRIQ